MKKVAVLAMALVMVLTGCISIEFEEDVSGAMENIEEQIEVELVQADGAEWRGVGVLITNGSDATIGEMEVQVLFYNEAGDIIAEESDGHDVVLPGSTVVSYVEAPEKYAKYDYRLDLDVDANGGYENHSEDMDIKTNVGDECVILQITNNADVTIDEFEYAVVFYKDGKIVDVTNGIDVYDIESGDTVIEECSTWGIDYDTYKVYINQAHTF